MNWSLLGFLTLYFIIHVVIISSQSRFLVPLSIYIIFFYKNNFIRTKDLFWQRKLRASWEQSQDCCPAEHKNKVSRLARAWTETGFHLYCTAYRLALLSHFNIAKLVNHHLVFSLVIFCWLNWKWELKQLFFLTFCYIITPIFGVIDYCCMYYGIFKKKNGKYKNKLRAIYV